MDRPRLLSLLLDFYFPLPYEVKAFMLVLVCFKGSWPLQDHSAVERGTKDVSRC